MLSGCTRYVCETRDQPWNLLLSYMEHKRPPRGNFLQQSHFDCLIDWRVSLCTLLELLRMIYRLKTDYLGYRKGTMPPTGASCWAHLSPCVSCFSAGCQTSSWKASTYGFQTKFDHDNPHHGRYAGSKVSLAKLSTFVWWVDQKLKSISKSRAEKSSI